MGSLMKLLIDLDQFHLCGLLIPGRVPPVAKRWMDTQETFHFSEIKIPSNIRVTMRHQQGGSRLLPWVDLCGDSFSLFILILTDYVCVCV